MSIHLQYFGLKKEPFSIVPDPSFLYPSHQHRQAVAHLKYGLDREGGFVLLSGEVGTGKTTLTRTMLQSIPAHIRVAYVLNSKLNETDLLASICDELSITLPTAKHLSFSKICIDGLNQDLLESHGKGQKTLIVVEEAQNLSDELLETLRLLSNLETNTHKLLHILLVGQPELVEILSKPSLRQLNQRVVSRFHLLPLDKTEVANYINHRLHQAGAARPIFEPGAINTVFNLTKGVPRLINLVCHQAMLGAYAYNSSTISVDLVKGAASEIFGQTRGFVPKKPVMAMLSLAFLILVSLGFLMFENTYFVTQKDRNQSAENIVEDLHTAQKKPNLIQSNVTKDSTSKDYIQNVQSTDTLISSGISQGNPQEVSASDNPLVNLLDIWGIKALAFFTTEEFIGIAQNNGLTAQRIESATLDEVLDLNRPGVVMIQQPDGRLESHLLVAINAESVTLLSKGKSRRVEHVSFNQQWTGNFLFLWRSPDMFELLRKGDVNKEGLSWLQTKFSQLDGSFERLITGGRFTDAVHKQVIVFQREQAINADGIVGKKTIMRLNQLTNAKIPRLVEGN
ncbi:MAG: AAA family ATPase [Porticoccaceae bacterium]|nr:AAA family ATPase [Porticoccaceae bacterium]MDG1474946.1 AAA family ATPase [Porticoccaceae bacterium]